MTVQYRITKILSTLLLAGLCSAPLLRAQQTNPATPQQAPETSQQPQQPATTQPAQASPTQTSPTQPATTQTTPAPAAAPTQNTQPSAPANQNQPQQNAPSGTTVNPSQAPLNPVTTYPDASDQPSQPSSNAAPAAPQTTTTIPEGPQPKTQTEPVGAATAESVPTSGGAAAKPAGIAIAPAKQHQTRSLLIKLGAVAAAGAALGTIFALSHGTSSTPPGTGIAGVTGR
jgi:hypothetical protein